MSRIADLISHHCPDGVEERSISDVATLERGKYISKKTAIPGDIPVIAGGRGPAYWHNEANRSGELLTVAGSGAYAGFIQYWDSPIFVSDAFSITTNPQVKTRFLYHWLKNKQDFLHSLKRGSGVPHVYPKDIARLKILVPPLEVQEEIVRILDFYTQLKTALESELEAELEARRKQYEYYRDSLLSLENLTNRLGKENVNLLPLGKLVVIKNGKDYKHLGTGTIPVYGSGGPMDVFVDTPSYSKPTVLLPRKGSITNVFYLDEPFWNIDTVFYTEIDTNQIVPKFFYHAVSSCRIENYSTGSAARPSLTQTALKKIKIPVPSLAEQERIVGILDKFDALVNDLSSGLPVEIAARRKRYEYYRNQLLTFTPAN